MGAATARSVRSHVAPAGRDDESRAASSRPQLEVVSGGKGKKDADDVADGLFSRIKTVSLVHVFIAIAILVAALLVSLALRTMMVQDSFEQAQVQTSISKLNQDIEDDQAELDSLQASLPDRAQKMGMVPQSGPLSIDLQGYQSTSKGQ